jgi:cytoskeleton protein RodZ
MAALPLENWSVASIRNTKGISLEEISQHTKIKVSTLRALEQGNFEDLPGGIYTISYIRQYAQAIGADEGLLVEFYKTLHHSTYSVK